ncbi:MAG: hypothetical protein NUW00_05425, partial [Candidatus Kaiserbacteria bacterium]|nr:hypothetical protein [Candidatus Kaiserbacteria bacterium]
MTTSNSTENSNGVNTTTHTEGTVTQIIGPIIDVFFADDIPMLSHALEVTHEDGRVLTLEVAQHLGGSRV